MFWGVNGVKKTLCILTNVNFFITIGIYGVGIML